MTIPTPGGTATVRFTASAVEVQVAEPADGFSVRVRQRGSTEVRIEFDDDDDERYRVQAWWSDGPRHSVESR